MSRARWSTWMFTINNPNVLTPDFWKHKPHYVVWQLEKGKQGTEHYQGYAVWNKEIGKKAVSKCMPRAWLSRRLGTHEQAKHYCTKPNEGCECKHCIDEPERLDGPWFYGTEEGIPLKKGQRTGLRD